MGGGDINLNLKEISCDRLHRYIQTVAAHCTFMLCSSHKGLVGGNVAHEPIEKAQVV